MDLRVLELFSGIGGMHYAFAYSKLQGKVVLAVDINQIANKVYTHNFNGTAVKCSNIQALTVEEIDKFEINMLLMSPPCQPHTRQGLQRDVNDPRSAALTHICSIISNSKALEYVLLENVKGFEESLAHKEFIKSLKAANFYWREFMLSPTQFGIPNTRYRYYCLARKHRDFTFTGDRLWDHLPGYALHDDSTLLPTVDSFLEPISDTANMLPPDVMLKRYKVMDIVNPESRKTMCFTKGYTHYCEGTGSVFTPLPTNELHRILTRLQDIKENSENIEIQPLELLELLKLRYFRPREVARLMSYPDEAFSFPDALTNRQKYRLLGNSLNVKVVGELLRIFDTDGSKTSSTENA